ncbi:MAG: hypothetical protein WD272_02730 [Balneolales bacterium]
MSPYKQDDPILFEANPAVNYSFVNNIQYNLETGEPYGYAAYFSYKPQVRMYASVSKPVRMPSYRIQPGFQYIHRLGNVIQKDPSVSMPRRSRFLSIAIESGHYSNGQNRCAFSASLEDGSEGCIDIYRSINSSTNLSDLLNRSSGNFSTNLTEVVVSYQYNKHTLRDDNGIPLVSRRIYFGTVMYHEFFSLVMPVRFGGYSDEDIDLYGKWRFHISYEQLNILNDRGPGEHARYGVFNTKVEYILNPHPHVVPVRIETSYEYYPWSGSDIGFKL